ncbi:hypothetical protein JHK85_002649 [Glycine max]|nr:hypothetical protein JHK85_002649 [Glycine max]
MRIAKSTCCTYFANVDGKIHYAHCTPTSPRKEEAVSVLEDGVNNWSNVESTTETTSRQVGQSRKDTSTIILNSSDQQSLHPSLLVCIISGSSEGKDRSMSTTATTTSEEVSSNEWKVIHMSEQEEDLIRRMYKLVGDKWNLIAGRIPGRKAEEIERFWIMRHGDAFSVKRNGSKTQDSRSTASVIGSENNIWC